MDKPQLPRGPRGDKGRVAMTARDVSVLRWIGEQYAVRLDQVAQLLGRDAQRMTQERGRVQASTAYRVLRRWLAASLVQSKYVLAGEPPWVYLTGKGLHELGLPFHQQPPNVALVNHYYWTNQVRLWTEQRYPQDRWVSERWLLRERVSEPAPGVPVADAEVQRGDPGEDLTCIAVEVELTVKESRRLQNILVARAEHYDGVWYFTTSATHKMLQRTLSRLDPEVQGLFRLRRLDDLI